MGIPRLAAAVSCVLMLAAQTGPQLNSLSASELVEYSNANGSLRLRGFLFRPAGRAPYPAVVFLHGAAGASDATVTRIGETFAKSGYLLFFPFRRGLGPSAGVGEAINDRLLREERAHGIEARMRLMAELLATEQLDDALGAVEYLQRFSDTNASRVAIFGHSFGGILGVLAAERGTGVRAVIAAAPAARNWASGPELRDLLRRAARNARAPIFLLQAANDVDLTPTEQLALEMSRVGKTHIRKIYPAWGTSADEGHDFAVLAPQVWAPDVFRFLAEHANGTAGLR